MKNHKLPFVLLACSLLFACAPVQTSTPTPRPTEPPAQTEQPPSPTLTEIPPTPEPSATPEPVWSNTPAPSGNITYFWPLPLPEEFRFSLYRENSRADAEGFILEFRDGLNWGMILRILGGTEADRYEYCKSDPGNPSELVMVRGLEGCFPSATGAGFTVNWTENDTHYSVGGMGFSKDLALAVAEKLEIIDLATFFARLNQ